MRTAVKSITVFCSSSTSLAPHYYEAGTELGRAIAQNNWKLVYGGNAIGLMKTVADAVRSSGGKVVGVTPQIFVDQGFCDQDCEELIVTADMRERKEILEQRGDAFIALPGGIGTLEEILEIISAKSVGFHDKPIALLNTADYWNSLLKMIDSGIEQRFIKPKARDLFLVAPDVSAAIRHLQASFHA